MKRIVITFFYTVLILLLSCNIYFDDETGPQEILVPYDQLTIAWNPPETDIFGTISEVQFYNIYYRRYNTTLWTFYAELAPSENPEITLDIQDFGTGLFEFAVSAVDKSQRESTQHRSTDKAADPFYGWYVNWTGA